MLFRGSQSDQRAMSKKVEALHHVCLATAIAKILCFLFSLFAFVVVAALNRVDAPTSKNYITV